MSVDKGDSSLKPFPDTTLFRLCLFVAGNEPNSLNARKTLDWLYHEYLKGRCEIKVIDVYEDYEAAIKYGIVVVPALVIESPPPSRTIVGSLTEREKLLSALGLTGEGGLP